MKNRFSVLRDMIQSDFGQYLYVIQEGRFEERTGGSAREGQRDGGGKLLLFSDFYQNFLNFKFSDQKRHGKIDGSDSKCR